MTAPPQPVPVSARAVPYLPGLDGLRALAVVAVMIYHADASWLPGGFLGVEVFFVISGYLITLLLISERESTGSVRLGGFWVRRARRLLPALGVLLVGVTAYTALFRAEALGRLRGDVLAGLGYVSNWYQIADGAGYAAAGDFAPLRHLWSLAVEEQFYVVWPLVMVGVLAVYGTRRLGVAAVVLFVIALGITVVTAVLHHSGPIGTCASTPEAYWVIGDRCVSKADALYLSTVTRFGGLLLGAAFAMIWRPGARARHVDIAGIAGLAGLGWLMFTVGFVGPSGADDWLFRGGFVVTDIATLAVIAAIVAGTTTNRFLSARPLVWIGTRSYGLYLFHWPTYQAIRGVAGNTLSLVEFAGALALTATVAELSYRYVEMPIRRGTFLIDVRHRWQLPTFRAGFASVSLAAVTLAGFSAIRLATEPVRPNTLELALAEGSQDITSLDALLATTSTATSTTTTTSTTSTSSPPAPLAEAITPSTQASTTTTTSSTTTSSTTTSTTTTTVPGIARLALGDSVLVGAAPDLAETGWVVNATIGRQTWDLTPVIDELHRAGLFGDVVAVNIGTNGAITDEQLDTWLDHMTDVRRIILITIRGDRSWIPPNNAKLRARAGGNVVVLDWATESKNCPGRCFDTDDIHLLGPGRRHLTQLLNDLVD